MDFVLTNASDLAIVGMLCAVLILVAVTRGGTGLLVLGGIALVLGGFITSIFPYTDTLATTLGIPAVWGGMLVLLLATLGSVLLLRNTVGYGLGSSSPRAIIGTAVALTALVIAFSYHIVPLDVVYNFGAPFDAVFAPAAHFFWIVIAALVLFFIL